MSGLNARDEPVVLAAPTGRGKCQTSQEPIAQGELKVGMVGRSSGVTVMKWMKPKYFAANMRVEYAPTGRAKCTSNHEESAPFIGKGEPRLLFRMMKTSSDGTEMAGCQQIYNPANAAVGELVRKYLDLEGVTTTVKTLGGLDEMEDAHRQWVVDALEGRDVSSRPVPVGAPPAKPRAPKKKKENADEENEENDEAKPAKRAKAPPKKKKEAPPPPEPKQQEAGDDESELEVID